jgi:hypothetical protein
MAINTANLETVLNSKIASATSSTLDKDLLLISKSVEALDNSISLKQTDIGVTVQGYNSDLATNASVATAVTDMATNASVATAVAGIVDSAPATLDTLNELATALGDDANFATTTTTAIGNKINTANPTFTGTLDGAGNSYTNLHPAVQETSAATTTYVMDFTLPYHDVGLNGATQFNISNLVNGRMCVLQLSPLGQVPTFVSEVKWAGAEEPTWADSNQWLISMTCISSTVVVASATGFTI